MGSMKLPKRCVQIDPFLGRYYADRSADSMAEEIVGHGFDGVQMVVTRDSRVHRELVQALRQRKLHVDYATFGNGTYDTQDLPAGWQDWRMVTRQPMNDGYTRLCLNHPEYRRWKKAQVASVLRQYRFDGVHIMEPFWPEYPGPSAPAYGCLCPRCLALFAKQFSGEQPPEFNDEQSPRFWRKQPELYAHWVQFRVQSHTDFLNDLLNGEGGIRRSHPHVMVTIWILAIDVPEAVKFVREVHGQDIAEVARQVRPDAICLQTHWPDWIKADLAPDYVRFYLPLVRAARAVAANMPIMIQADIGSQPQNRRSWDWIARFQQACRAIGVQSSTLYEYHLGMYMYTEPPRVLKAVRLNRAAIQLVFNKRLDAESAGRPASYRLSPPVRIRSVQVDGNLVRLTTDPLRPAQRYQVTVSEVRDHPASRWLPDTPALTCESHTVTV